MQQFYVTEEKNKHKERLIQLFSYSCNYTANFFTKQNVYCPREMQSYLYLTNRFVGCINRL